MAKTRQKISHHRRILHEQTLQEAYILPGMILRFNYDQKGVYDRRPLFFFMYRDAKTISGINFNYLHEERIQKFFKLAQSLTPVWEENLLRLPLPYLRLQLSTPRAVTSVGSQLLYKMVIPRDIHYKNAYRSYSLDIISSLKVVNYKLDFISTEHGRRSAESIAKRKNVKQELGKTKEAISDMKDKTVQDTEGIGKDKVGGNNEDKL